MSFGIKTLKAAAVAGALALMPLAASAATVHIDDANLTDGLAANYAFATKGDEFVYDSNFAQGTLNAGDQAIFTFTNNSGVDLTVLAGQSASVNPDASQNPEPVFNWDGGTDVILDGGNIKTTIASGATSTLTITFGSNNQSFSNVDVFISAVPLPAGALLLLTALGGLGLARRKSKAA